MQGEEASRTLFASQGPRNTSVKPACIPNTHVVALETAMMIRPAFPGHNVCIPP